MNAFHMATNLLHCCICPKRPDFSDTSHLLTHVSSKGHLSHLHKLQVRSHQEASAGQQLMEYNQWFVDYNVAHLLSERMLQKEKKQAKRKADNEHRLATSKRSVASEVDPSLLPDSKYPLDGSHGYAAVDTSAYQGLDHLIAYTDTNMYPNTPVPQASSRLYTTLHARTDSSTSYSSNTCDAFQAQAEHVGVGYTPEMARLKGTIWPGMDIFDSADAETQRKRNQRKDTSVIERMRSLSERVEPMETVCSPGGTMKKKRHMDDLEDDSPVEGESPMVKQSSKRRRKALASISNNTTRLALRSKKATQPTYGLVSTPSMASPPATKVKPVKRMCSPQPMDPFILGVSSTRAPSHRQRRQRFKIFDDRAVASSTFMTTNDSFADPFYDIDEARGHPEPLVSPSKIWIQSTQRSEYEDPFKGLEPMHLMTDNYSPMSGDKEGINPLAWQQTSKPPTYSPNPITFGRLDDFDETLGALAEVYAFTRNPLVVESPPPGAQTRTPFRQPPRGGEYLSQRTSSHR